MMCQTEEHARKTPLSKEGGAKVYFSCRGKGWNGREREKRERDKHGTVVIHVVIPDGALPFVSCHHNLSTALQSRE